MDNKDFKKLYKKLVENHDLSPHKAKEILRIVLSILSRDKEDKN